MTETMPSSGLLSISVTRRDREETMFCLTGRVTIDSSPELRERLHAMLLEERPRTLTIDLTGVPYVDSSGIATLLEALRVARGCGTALRLMGLHDRPLYLFQFTGLLSLFEPSPGSDPSSASETH